tara:strand:- start:22 stop:1359 length:1338 start_codon:yes stop_codon:yes gene_type:complete
MSTIKVNTVTTRSGSTLTLGESGKTVAIASGASTTGMGRAGAVDWQTSIKTATFTAASGEGYFCNTSGGAFTMNLPSSPSVGDIVAIKDYGSSFSTHALTIGRNGSNLNGDATDSTRNTDNESLTMVYADATKGWLAVEEGTGFIGEGFIDASGGNITTVGNCKIHTFTGPGTFTVNAAAGCATNNIVSYLVLGGGGSGGTDVGGGGGAGGFREIKNPVTPYTASPLDGFGTPGNRVTVTATGFPITVGGGGAAPPGSPGKGADGVASVFSTISAAGGGAGGQGPGPGTDKNGNPGGSGGGGGGWTRPAGCGGPLGPGCVGAPGAGNTPPVTPPQGNNGGIVSPGGSQWPGAGGGGATAVGANSPGPSPLTTTTAGGAGATTTINNSPVTYAAGGSGGGDQSTVPTTTVAADNSGGGGGGAGNYPSPNRGNAGGSGIVIIRYKFQ